MTKEHVAYVNGELHITYRKGVATVSPSSILQLNTCLLSQCAPDLSGAVDEFYILIQAQQFWRIGPLIHGAIPAIDALTRAHPEIPRWEMHLHKLPWHLRAPSCLGLRLFPDAGLGCFPLKALPAHTQLNYCTLPLTYLYWPEHDKC